jgi:predicted nucleic acid-binding protein
MLVYLDVCCLGRPFDDQGQTRIRLEAEAVYLVLERIDAGELDMVSSEMADIEIDAGADPERRKRVRELLPPRDDIIELTPAVFRRAATLEKLGFKPADAVHTAAAESAGVDVLLSCDDRFCKAARRHRGALQDARDERD